MVIKFLNALKSKTTKGEFKEILAMVDQDVKFNRVSFGKCTSPKEFINVCNIAYRVIKGVELNAET